MAEVGKRRCAAVCNAREEGERYETNTTVLPRCDYTREGVDIAAVSAIYDVYGVGRRAMCGGEEEAMRPAGPPSRRHSRDRMLCITVCNHLRDDLHWSWADMLDDRMRLPTPSKVSQDARIRPVNFIDDVHGRVDFTNEHPSRTIIFADITSALHRLLELEGVSSTPSLDSPNNLCEEANQLENALRDLRVNEPALRYNSERFSQIQEMANLVLNRLRWIESTISHMTHEEVAEEEKKYWEP